MSSRRAQTLKSELAYAGDLFEAGIDGVVAAWKSAEEGARPGKLTREMWAPALVGGAIGALSTCLGQRKMSAPRTVVGALVGGALGFSVGVVWSSRSFTRSATRSAVEKVTAVRDAHWLEKNPVAYA